MRLCVQRRLFFFARLQGQPRGMAVALLWLPAHGAFSMRHGIEKYCKQKRIEFPVLL